MKCTYEKYGARGIAFRFDGKPSESIRTAMKSAGFRWSPSSGLWSNMNLTQWADLYAWIVKELASPGASMDFYLAAEHERLEAERRRIASDDFDLANNRSL